MNILSCNVGSTSLKYRLYRLDHTEAELASGHFEGIGRDSGHELQKAGEKIIQRDFSFSCYSEAIVSMLSFLEESGVLLGELLSGVAFKVVAALHVSGVCMLNEDVIRAMEAFNTLLPAHNPPYIAAIRQFQKMMPQVPLIGSFETGFFKNMPECAYLYALPMELAEMGVRRNGAHGASHEYVTQWAAEKYGSSHLKLISCHLGGSSSIAAVSDGQCMDTTLGLSLQSGLPHNNRIGDIDPYLSIYLQESLGYTQEEVKTLFSSKSGLLGLSGFSGEMSVIIKAAEKGHSRAQSAINVYCYQIKKYIGSFIAALGYVDLIVFTGGIGQNSPLIRKRSLENLENLGIQVDQKANNTAVSGSLISTAESKVKVLVAATNEELIIARKAKDYLSLAASAYECV